MTRLAGAWCSPMRLCATSRAATPRPNRRISDRFRPLGRYRHPLSSGRVIRSGGHGFCGIERRRLLNILQERAAELGVEPIFKREVHDVAEFGRRRPDRRGGRRQQRDPHALRRSLPAIHRRAHQQIRLARHTQIVRCLHLHLCRNRVGLVSGARLPLQRRHLDLHRGDTRRDLACGGPRPNGRAASLSLLRASFSRLGSTAHMLLTNMRHLRGIAVHQLQPRLQRELVEGRIVLMGDAAHTAHFSIGSGPSSRWRMPSVLPCIDRHPDDIATALAAMRPSVASKC